MYDLQSGFVRGSSGDATLIDLDDGTRLNMTTALYTGDALIYAQKAFENWRICYAGIHN